MTYTKISHSLETNCSLYVVYVSDPTEYTLYSDFSLPNGQTGVITWLSTETITVHVKH